MSCTCPNPDLCIALKRHISGHLWDYWNGFDAKSARYRAKWLADAGLAEVPKGMEPTGEVATAAAVQERKEPCKFRGDKTGEIECLSCGCDKEGKAKTRVFSFACEKFSTCTIGTHVPGIVCCASCPSYSV